MITFKETIVLPDRYTFSNLKYAIRNPEYISDEFYHFLNKAINAGYKKRILHRYGPPFDVVSADWDNLIVLDALRFDVFDNIKFSCDNLTRIVSAGSMSDEWIENNFRGRSLHDTVYVSSNVYSNDIESDVFYKVIKTYTEYENNIAGRMPDQVTNTALEAYTRNQNKRLIVHYMQPHAPYIGPTADTLRDELREEYGFQFSAIERARNELDEFDEDKNIHTLLQAAEEGYITKDSIRNVYNESLHNALSSIERLVQSVQGKTVITADHGELFGAGPGGALWGHPRDCWYPDVRLVPWCELTYEDRRKIRENSPIEDENIDKDTVRTQLKDLGYV